MFKSYFPFFLTFLVLLCSSRLAHGLSSKSRWHLQRVVQRKKLSDEQIESGKKEFDLRTILTQHPVTIYVVDSGIRIEHEEFTNNRAVYGINIIDPLSPPTDCNGHGTHVAALAAGAYSGVATNARIVSVRVLDCAGRGRCRDVVKGLQWIANDVKRARAKGNNPFRAVVVMSIGSRNEACASTEPATVALWNMGVVVTAAAGNQRIDSCTAYPVRNNHTIGVGAVDSLDRSFPLNNYGDCVDIYAPGVDLLSAWGSCSNTELRRASGTSMAAPLVAGVAAIMLSADPTLSPHDVKNILISSSTKDKITTVDASRPLTEVSNRLLYAPWNRLFEYVRRDVGHEVSGIGSVTINETVEGNPNWNESAVFCKLSLTLRPQVTPAMLYTVDRLKELISEALGIGVDSILGRRAEGANRFDNGLEPETIDLRFYVPIANTLMEEYTQRLTDAEKEGLFENASVVFRFTGGSLHSALDVNVTVPIGLAEWQEVHPLAWLHRHRLAFISIGLVLLTVCGMIILKIYKHFEIKKEIAEFREREDEKRERERRREATRMTAPWEREVMNEEGDKTEGESRDETEDELVDEAEHKAKDEAEDSRGEGNDPCNNV